MNLDQVGDRRVSDEQLPGGVLPEELQVLRAADALAARVVREMIAELGDDEDDPEVLLRVVCRHVPPLFSAMRSMGAGEIRQRLFHADGPQFELPRCWRVLGEIVRRAGFVLTARGFVHESELPKQGGGDAG